MRKLMASIGLSLLLAAVLAPAAGANERLLTLYSPRIDSLPYVHDTHQVPLLRAAGGAPKRPGYILGFKEMVLVDSKDPDANDANKKAREESWKRLKEILAKI